MITHIDIMISGSFLRFLHAVLLLAFCLQSIIGFNSAENIKCIESERQALLRFKKDLQDDYGVLSSWINEDKDCCRWERVQCSSQIGGHINKLDLHGREYQKMTGLVNSSLIQLQHLTYLDLSNNLFNGSIPEFLGSLSNLEYLNLSNAGFSEKIPYHLGNLSCLQILDLSHNYLAEAIPPQFGNLTSLQSLYLNSNYELKMNNGNPADANWLVHLSSLTHLDLSHLQNLNYSYHLLEMIAKIPNLRVLLLRDTGLSDEDLVFPALSDHLNTTSFAILDLSANNLTSASQIFQWVFNFSSNLQELSLDYNFLQGSIPDGFSNTMNSLKDLHLSGNKLGGGIPESLGNICTLQLLSLDNNFLSGNLSGFIHGSLKCKRHALQCLHLSNNRINGTFPDLSMFSSLERVSLARNQVKGQVPESISLLSELKELYLQENSLGGEITESHLGNFSKLQVLVLSSNSLVLRFNTSWIPHFQLYIFGAESCKLGPEFPVWIKSQERLFYLDISNASISDNVPSWFWNLFSRLIHLNISNNILTGTIPNLPLEHANFPSVDLSSNQLGGSVPPFLMKASKLKLSKNNFSDFVSFLCGNKNVEKISVLDLSKNQLSGKLPDCWSHLKSLGFLDLSNNNLSGNIPTSLGTLVNMVSLVLRNNQLNGKLPSSLKNCTGLKILDVAENQLSGLIPSWIGKRLLRLEILLLRGNRLDGSLPLNLCNLVRVQVFDLSLNSLTREIPACIGNFTAMADESVSFETIHAWYGFDGQYDYYTPIMWKRTEQEFKNPDLRLKSIDLSSNNLIGELPKEVGNLRGLRSLNLSRNNLTGEIISGIGNLKLLDSLDLSRNHFVGRIPPSLAQIDRLGVLDLSYNRLSGKIPVGPQLQTFDESSYEGNLDLCGEPLNRSCIVPCNNPGDEDDKAVFFEALYTSLGIGFATGFWSILGSIMLIPSWRDAYFLFVDNAFAAVYKAKNHGPGSLETSTSW